MTGRRPDDGAITIGQVVGPHGIQGGLRVKVLTDFVERFEPGRTIYLNGEPKTISKANWHKDQVRLQLKEVNDRNLAEDLKWAQITVPADDLPELDEDEFLTAELLGLRVITTEGQEIGKVTEVLASPAHDIIVVGKTMIPAVEEFVHEIDLDNGTMTVELIEGMLEE